MTDYLQRYLDALADPDFLARNLPSNAGMIDDWRGRIEQELCEIGAYLAAVEAAGLQEEPAARYGFFVARVETWRAGLAEHDRMTRQRVATAASGGKVTALHRSEHGRKI